MGSFGPAQAAAAILWKLMVIAYLPGDAFSSFRDLADCVRYNFAGMTVSEKANALERYDLFMANRAAFDALAGKKNPNFSRADVANPHQRIKNLSDSAQAAFVAERLSAVLRRIEYVSCHGHCNFATSSLIQEAESVGLAIEKNEGGRLHRFGRYGDLIIDPTIFQYIDHPEADGIFIGTADDLARFVNKHAAHMRIYEADVLLEKAWNIRKK